MLPNLVSGEDTHPARIAHPFQHCFGTGCTPARITCLPIWPLLGALSRAAAPVEKAGNPGAGTAGGRLARRENLEHQRRRLVGFGARGGINQRGFPGTGILPARTGRLESDAGDPACRPWGNKRQSSAT